MKQTVTFTLWLFTYLIGTVSPTSPVCAQTIPAQTTLISSPRQSFTPTPQSVRGYWNIDVIGDFYLPRSKSITFSGAARNLHVSQDWQKIFRRGFSSVERSRMTPEEIGVDRSARLDGSTKSNREISWSSRLTPDQRALILYQNYFIDPPFNLYWAKNSELARQTYFEQPSGSARPRESIGNAMSELNGGCVAFNDCPSTGQLSTFGKIYFDIENEGTSLQNRQEHANLYVYKMWTIRKSVSPYTEIGGIGPVPHNSYGNSRASDYVTSPDWLWSMQAKQIAETNTRGRGMPDAIVGKSFGEQTDFQMPGTYYLSSDFDYSAPHNGDGDRHWLASLLGEQEVNMKLSSKKRIAWQWLFNTQSNEAGQANRAEHPAPPTIAEGMGIFYWFTGANGTVFWDDWDDLTPNAPVVPGRENLDNNRNYACYEHYLHGLWRLFKHHGDLFNGQEKYLNEQTECSYDNGNTWYRLNANAQKQSRLPFARIIVNGDNILIAATQPYASANKQSQLMVRYIQDGYRFYTTINLRGDEIFLGRAKMPTGNSTFPPSATAIGSPTPPESGLLAATVVSYNCATGAIVFGKTGGINATTEFSAIGITGWTTNLNHTIEAGLRADPKTMSISVRQNGAEGIPFMFDMRAYCSGPVPPPATPTNTAPTVVNAVGTQSAMVSTGYSLNISNVFTDSQTPNQLSLSATGLPSGLSLSGNVITGTPSISGIHTITLTATDPGGLLNRVSFVLTISSQAGNPPVNPPTGSGLAATVVSYNCATGAIVFGKTGGINATTEFSAIGITGWTTNLNHTIEAGLRADPKTMSISVRQNGVEGTPFMFDMRAYCSGPVPPPATPTNTAPTVVNAVGTQSAMVSTGYSLNIGNVFTDAQTPGQLMLSITGLPVGLSLSGNTIVGTPSNAGVSTITLRATDPGGLSTSTSFQLTVSPQATNPTPTCGSPANTIGQPIRVTGLKDINCQNGSFRVVTTGGNGSVINYAGNVGLNNADPANCLRVLDNPDMVRAINNPNSDIGLFQIRVLQSGNSSNFFPFNFKQYCTGASSRTAQEVQDELSVLVLGNPSLEEWAEVEVQGVSNEPVAFRVLRSQGHEVSHQQVEPSGNTVRQRIWLGRAGGLLLIQVSTPTRTKTVKIVRQ